MNTDAIGMPYQLFVELG